MPITAFTGTPGSGKTYDAVRCILDNLRLGKSIYTNIDGLNDWQCRKMIESVCNIDPYGIEVNLVYLTPEQASEFWLHIPQGAIVVLDEVQKIFNGRDWQSKGNKEFASWCSTHRHNGHELILITQDAGRLDVAVRSLLEWCYIYRKVNFFGSLVKNSYVRYSYAGEPHGPALMKEVRSYDPTIFLCYQSYTSKDIKEMGIMKHVNVLKHPVFYALPVLLIFTLYLFFFKSSFSKGDLFGPKAMLKTPPKAQKTATAPATNPATNPAAPQPGVRKYVDPSGRIIFTNRSSTQNEG